MLSRRELNRWRAYFQLQYNDEEEDMKDPETFAAEFIGQISS